MSLSSKIEWTDATWNPVRGCTKISPVAPIAMRARLRSDFGEFQVIRTSKVLTSSSFQKE